MGRCGNLCGLSKERLPGAAFRNTDKYLSRADTVFLQVGGKAIVKVSRKT